MSCFTAPHIIFGEKCTKSIECIGSEQRLYFIYRFQINSCVSAVSPDGMVMASFGICHTLGDWLDSQSYLLFKHNTSERKVCVWDTHIRCGDSIFPTKS